MLLGHLLACLLLLTLPDDRVEARQYLMFAGNKEVGNLTVERLEQGAQTLYRSENITSISLIKKFTLKHEVETTFEDGRLRQSEVWVYLNDKLREHTRTLAEGDGYRVLRDGEPPLRLDQPIAHTSLTMYFEEPEGVQAIFSEQYGEMYPLSEAGQQVYQLDRSGNRTNLYFYRDDLLVRAEFETMLFTARLELQ